MSNEAISSLEEAFLAASLPLDPSEISLAAEKTIDFYAGAPARVALPEKRLPTGSSNCGDSGLGVVNLRKSLKMSCA